MCVCDGGGLEVMFTRTNVLGFIVGEVGHAGLNCSPVYLYRCLPVCVHCTLYAVRCTVYSVQCTVYSVYMYTCLECQSVDLHEYLYV